MLPAVRGAPALRQRDEAALADWLQAHEAASARYASCRYVETVGNGRAKGQAENLITLHDRLTCCEESLPLA